MTAPRGALRQHATQHIDGELGTRVQPLAEYDRVVIHLGWISDATLHLDRAGIALLESALERARADLDTAEDETAAAIEAEHQAARLSKTGKSEHDENAA